MRAVFHGIIEHNRNQTLQCNPGFDGDFQALSLARASLAHMACSPGVRCSQIPETRPGKCQVSCNDGTVIHVDGFCYMNCVPGTITSNTITLPHEALAHGQNTTVECPIDAWSGSMRKPETTVLSLWFPLVPSTQPHRAGVTEQNATTEGSKKGCFISRERAP